jgi:D-alanyl-D-alanine carboxypeptidase/D-alanyl-D-alanine-endopeptidase (penicillin-binding protein 4)
MKINISTLLVALFLFITSCSVQKIIVSPYQNIINEIKTSPVNQQYQVGFILKEIGSSKIMVEQQADHYFTPASNTKLYTFYTALNMLGDSIPTFKYVINKDSLIIWPMADASFLHPDFKNQPAFNFLKNSNKTIYLVTGRYSGEKFGPGWSWGDYNDYYQTEITELPIYGNAVNITATAKGEIKYSPDVASLYLSEIEVSPTAKKVVRELGSNNLTVPKRVSANYEQTVPLHLSKRTVENLLTDTLLATGMVIKPIINLEWRSIPENAKTFYSIAADTLYQHMLQPSDNFIAEEMLLNCAAAKNLSMNTDSVIAYSKKNYLNDLPDKIAWVDGSGLSRYNLFTPRDMAALLQKIYDKMANEKLLFCLLPNGGKSGTIRNMFKTGEPSFVFAKSGSLANNYNLSGYLIGKSGKKYIFSFMNNNFVKPTSEIRAEVERVLTFIHDNY